MPFAPRITRWTILIALLALPLFAQAELSAKVSERTRQKQAAEQERAELGKKLDALKEEIFTPLMHWPYQNQQSRHPTGHCASSPLSKRRPKRDYYHSQPHRKSWKQQSAGSARS